MNKEYLIYQLNNGFITVKNLVRIMQLFKDYEIIFYTKSGKEKYYFYFTCPKNFVDDYITIAISFDNHRINSYDDFMNTLIEYKNTEYFNNIVELKHYFQHYNLNEDFSQVDICDIDINHNNKCINLYVEVYLNWVVDDPNDIPFGLSKDEYYQDTDCCKYKKVKGSNINKNKRW